MQPDWSSHTEETIRRLCENLPSDIDPNVRREALGRGALPVGLDLWSHFFLRPDGTLLRIDMEKMEHERGSVETFTDRSHVLWGLVMGSERYAELRELLPVRPAEARDCECTVWPAKFSRAFCPKCGGMRWLP